MTSEQLDIQQRSLAHAKSSSFADFINNGTSAQKKKLYKTVLAKASESQQRIIESARKLRSS
jgi:hypothetical protein